MIRKNGIKIAIGMTLLIAAGSVTAFADTAMGGNTFQNSRAGKMVYGTGIPQLIKMPFKIFVKAGDSMQQSTSSGYLSSEDVVVGEPYNLDAETTG